MNPKILVTGATGSFGALYGAVRAGYRAAVTDDVKRVTGQDPVTLEHSVKASQARW